MMYGTTAAKGVFTVNALGKKVQFANANETDLVQWSTANAWREDQKEVTGHNGWYVLSHSEWTHLLVTRTTTGNSECTVDGKKGIVILPDNWVKPAGVPNYNASYTDPGYGTNVYTASEWELMAQSGAVFLPCKGYSTDGTVVINPTDHGRYWASDDNSTDGYTMSFDAGYIHDQNTSDKELYCSMILVKTVTVTELNETDDKDAFKSHRDDAMGQNFAIVNRTLAKDSTLYTLCLPFDVPNIDASPLQGAEVFEFLGGHVSGSTGNEQLYLNMQRLDGKRLKQGVPYILRWAKTNPVQTLTKLRFYDVENWDTDTTTATPHPGNENIKFRGVYPKTHIPDYDDAEEAHYNFFLGANNTLYWPDAAYTHAEGHDMKGFRAYFYITPGGYPAPDPSPAPYRNMPVVWEISEGLDSPTDTGYWTLDNGHCKKQLRNGQIILVIDGKEYDLQGKVIGN